MWSEHARLAGGAIDFSNSPVLLDRNKNFILPIPKFTAITPDKIIFLERDYHSKCKNDGNYALAFSSVNHEEAERINQMIKDLGTDITKLSYKDFQILISEIQRIGNFFVSVHEKQSLDEQFREVSDSNVGFNSELKLGYVEVSDQTEYKVVKIEKPFSGDDGVHYYEGAFALNNGSEVTFFSSSESHPFIPCNWVKKDSAGNEVKLSSIDEALRVHKLKTFDEKLANLTDEKLTSLEEMVKASAVEKLIQAFTPHMDKHTTLHSELYLNTDNVQLFKSENEKVKVVININGGGQDSIEAVLWFPLVLAEELKKNGVSQDAITIHTLSNRDYSWDCLGSNIAINFDNLGQALEAITNCDLTDIKTSGKELLKDRVHKSYSYNSLTGEVTLFPTY